MINGKDLYQVLAALVPLYVVMILAYGSVRWWKIFTPDQCSGINRFVAVFAVPLLSFHFISSNDPYAMNYRFIAADSLQKVVMLFALLLWQVLDKNGSLEWVITLFSLSTLPNTLVMGIPLLKAMYGDFSASLMVQIVVLQSVIWYTLMLFMFEYRGAKLLIAEQFPGTAASITSFKVESDVMSLNGREPLETDAEIVHDGKLHVVIRRSTSSRSIISSYSKSYGLNSRTSITPQISNLSGVEIYSIESPREPSPMASSFNQRDFCAMFDNKMLSPKHDLKMGFRSGDGGGDDDVYSSQSSRKVRARTSNFEEEMMKFGRKRGGRSMSSEFLNDGLISYPPPYPMFSGSTRGGGGLKKKKEGHDGGPTPKKDLHMFVWSSTASSPVSEGNQKNAKAARTDFGLVDSSKVVPQQETTPSRGNYDYSENTRLMRKINGDEELEIEDTSKSPVLTDQKRIDMGVEQEKLGGDQQMPPASVMTRLILVMVWRKLIRNPNTYASLIGLVWSLVSFRWNIQMPSIVKGSISILSDTGLGMAMFSLGLFMALQPKMIACGKLIAAFSMAVRFLIGPAVIAATSAAIGIRGVLLRVVIVQAALPQGIVPFVFAKEYNVHADILSTAVIFGMLIALPTTIVYYVILELF